MSTQDAETPYIIVDGKQYKLWKRGDKEDSPWWFRAQYMGVRRSMSTGTTDVESAKERAEKIVSAVLKGQWLKFEDLRTDAPKPNKGWPTFAQVFAVARKMKVESIELYIRSCTTLVSEALNKKDIDKLTVDVLTAPLVKTFQAQRQGFKRAILDRITPGNTPCNAIVSNAKSLFGKKAMEHYENSGLSLPPLRGFREAPALVQFRPRYSDEMISNALLAELDKALPSASEAIQKMVNDVQLRGVSPGTFGSTPETQLRRWLSQFNILPHELHHHAGACMYVRSASLQVAAEFCGVSMTTAEWHWGQIKVSIKPLSLAERYI